MKRISIAAEHSGQKILHGCERRSFCPMRHLGAIEITPESSMRIIRSFLAHRYTFKEMPTSRGFPTKRVTKDGDVDAAVRENPDVDSVGTFQCKHTEVIRDFKSICRRNEHKGEDWHHELSDGWFLESSGSNTTKYITIKLDSDSGWENAGTIDPGFTCGGNVSIKCL